MWLEVGKHTRFQYWEGHYVLFKFQREAEARQCVSVSVVLQNSLVRSCENESHPKVLERMEPWGTYKEKLKSLYRRHKRAYMCHTANTRGWRYSKSTLFYHNPEIWEPRLQNVVFPITNSGFGFDMNIPFYAQDILIWDRWSQDVK